MKDGFQSLPCNTFEGMHLSTDDAAEEILFVHQVGMTTAFVRSDASARSSFGGAIATALAGVKFGPRPLHQIGQLALADIHLTPELTPFTCIPLLYGMSFDGCDLRYRIANSGVDIESCPLTDPLMTGRIRTIHSSFRLHRLCAAECGRRLGMSSRRRGSQI